MNFHSNAAVASEKCAGGAQARQSVSEATGELGLAKLHARSATAREIRNDFRRKIAKKDWA